VRSAAHRTGGRARSVWVRTWSLPRGAPHERPLGVEGGPHHAADVPHGGCLQRLWTVTAVACSPAGEPGPEFGCNH
jgi:hypothetical protein